MHLEPDANDLRRSALDLLASGNSAHAVAVVLWALIVIGGLALAVFTMAFGLRSGFELSERGVAWQGAWRRRELAFAEVLDGRIAWHAPSGRYMLTLRARSGAAGGTIWLTGEQVRQPGIARWIASLHRPGDERFVPREDVDDADEGGFLNGLIRVLMVMQVLCFAAICFMEGQMLAKDLHLLRHGPTPLASLSVTEGALLSRDACHQPRRGVPVQYVKIQTAAGVKEFGLPCVIDRAAVDRPGFRHIVVRTDEQSFGDHEIYSIELDGVALRSYASHAGSLRRSAGSSALMHVLLMILAGIVTAVGARSLPRWRRR